MTAHRAALPLAVSRQVTSAAFWHSKAYMWLRDGCVALQHALSQLCCYSAPD